MLILFEVTIICKILLIKTINKTTNALKIHEIIHIIIC